MLPASGTRCQDSPFVDVHTTPWGTGTRPREGVPCAVPTITSPRFPSAGVESAVTFANDWRSRGLYCQRRPSGDTQTLGVLPPPAAWEIATSPGPPRTTKYGGETGPVYDAGGPMSTLDQPMERGAAAPDTGWTSIRGRSSPASPITAMNRDATRTMRT